VRHKAVYIAATSKLITNKIDTKSPTFRASNERKTISSYCSVNTFLEAKKSGE